MAETWTPGPWAWRGHKGGSLELVSLTPSWPYVMRMVRYWPTFPVDGEMVSATQLVELEAPYRNEVAAINHPNARLIAEAPKMATEARTLLDVIQNVMERGFIEVPGMEILREAMEPIEVSLARIRGEATNG